MSSPARTPSPSASPTASPTKTPSAKQADATRQTEPDAPPDGDAGDDEDDEEVGQADIDQAEIEKLCEAAGLPAPPDFKIYPADIALHLERLIHKAAAQPTADSIGVLGCFYHDLMNNRPSSERARECYERAKSLAPDDYRWPQLLGRLFLIRQSLVRARMEFTEAIRIDPQNADNYGWLGDLEFQDQAYEEARENYAKVIELAPDEPFGYAALGDVEVKLGNLDEALPHIQKALEIDSRSKRAHMAMSAYYEQKGDEQAATRHQTFSDKLLPTGITRHDPINLLLARSAGPTRVGIRRLRSWASAGLVERALDLRDAMVEDYPNNAFLLAGVGEVTLALGRVDEAMDYLKKALAIDPRLARAMVSLADCYMAKDQADEALTWAQRAQDTRENLAAAHIAKGRALQRLGRHDEAVTAFKRAVELQPKNVPLKTTTGELLLIQGKLDEAREWCGQVVRAGEASGDMTKQYAPAYAILANVARQQGDGDAALYYLSRSLSLDPTRGGDFRMASEMLVQSGRAKDAVEMAKKLMEHNPQILSYTIAYGDLLAQAGEFDKAIAHFEKLCADLPTQPVPRYSLGAIYRSRGDTAKAMGYLEQAIALQPAYESAHLMLLDVARNSGDVAKAFSVVERAHRDVPQSTTIDNSYAWMLATTADEAHRDPQQGIELAEKTVSASQRRVANYLDTLACAYAAAGRFDDAISAEKEAIAVAKERNDSDMEVEFAERIKLFESGKAYVETPDDMSSD